ncbi:alcohol dehydrogenase catalytic domain-containing protein [Candidatus Litorirhabdus singularis]|nr:alcohol dehydrogenase catalytic domain-containing protein [Candidatus Litorirhabdus singularis]
MSQTMSAYRMLQWQQPPQLMEVEVPEPGPDEILVRVAGNGLCHSDLHMMHMPGQLGPTLGWQMPFTLGHETAGWIERWGSRVTGLQQGQAVALVSPTSCGSCHECLSGHDNVCGHNGVGRGFGFDGGLAEFVLVRDKRSLIALEGLEPLTAGPLTDAGATSWHGFNRIRPQLLPGANVLVIGAGGLGSFAVQYIKLLTQARLIVADIASNKLEHARSLGADICVDSSAVDLGREVMQLTEGQGVVAVLDFVGNEQTIAAGIAVLGKLGSYGLVGGEMGGYPQPLFHALASKEAQIFSFMGPTIADTQAVLALAAEGALVNEVEVFELADVGEAYRRLGAGELTARAVIRTSG